MIENEWKEIIQVENLYSPNAANENKNVSFSFLDLHSHFQRFKKKCRIIYIVLSGTVMRLVFAKTMAEHYFKVLE